MTALEARDRLAILAQAKSNPTLCPPELDFCLSRARVCDVHGNAPDSADWCGAWDIIIAAREAWELKAGKAANYHDVTIDGRTFAANQVFKDCQAQADRYRRRIAGTISCQTTYSHGDGLPLVCNCDAK
jgi:hypothetical protein